MKTDRRWFLGMAFALPLLLIGGTLIYADDDNGTVVRWDIINLFPPSPPSCPVPGGEAAATTHHNDNSTITLTGSGTFNPEDPGDVSGGGTWETATASGTYRVKSLVLWQPAPGFNVCSNDSIPGQRAAGHVVLRIKYNDGSRGVLTVSCRLPGTPAGVFEGIAVSKGFIDYTHNVEPAPNVNANRTLFHIQQDDDGDGDKDKD